MPELPEVQTVVDSLQEQIPGKQVAEVEVRNEKLLANVGPEELAEVVVDRKIESVTRRGKYIIIAFDNDYYLVAHLRMTGRFVYTEEEADGDKYDYILFYFTDDSRLSLGSKRKFTRAYLVEDLEEAGSLTELGPEPLSEEFTREKFAEMLSTRRGKIKPLLLNQKFLAGLGNIYVDESLYLAGVHPERTADTLTDEEINRLQQAIRQVLKEGIKHRGTTKWDYVDASGKAGSYQHYLRVYDREGKPCPECKTELERIKVGGRSSYFCPVCQEE